MLTTDAIKSITQKGNAPLGGMSAASDLVTRQTASKPSVPGAAGYLSNGGVYGSKNDRGYAAIDRTTNTTLEAQSWQNRLLFPQMQGEVAEQEGRETAVWNQAQGQSRTLDNMAAGQQRAGQQQAGMMDQQQGASFRNAAYADGMALQDAQRYNSGGRAAQDAIMRDAATYDSGARAEQEAGMARADTMAAAGVQRSEQQRQQQAYGINPNSGASMARDTATRNATVAESVGAGNRARMAAEQLGWSKKMDAANVGQQMFANSQASSGLGMQQRQLGAGLGAQGVEMRGAGAGLMGQSQSTLTNGFNAGQAGIGNVQGLSNTYNQGVQTQLQGFGQAGELAGQDYATRTGQSSAAAANKTARRGQNQEMIGGVVGLVGTGLAIF